MPSGGGSSPTGTVTFHAGTATIGTSTVRNFTTPQTYTITAADLSTQTYTVTITPGGASDHVKVTLPNPETRGFARLKVSQ